MNYNKESIVVLKFGSSVLRDENDLPRAVHEIYRWWREGRQVLAVVSAFGDTTDQLLRRAESIAEQPEHSSLATLLATGEAASSALLGMVLNRAGIPARVLDSVQAGLRTIGAGLEADLVAVDTVRLKAELRRGVVVLPGFVGRGENGDTTLLGRGGSDLTALFLAQKLNAQCLLVKDIDGLYTSDPAITDRALRFEQASYQTAARLGGRLVQLKAVRFAETHRQRFMLTCIGASERTDVGPFGDRLSPSSPSDEPLKVALLGCGTVGGGVYERLAALPELFTITGVGTRTGEEPRAAGVPEHLITSDLEQLVDQPCDVVVELIGGTDRAATLTEQALRSGRRVVSANKALMAANGVDLEDLAEKNGTTLRYSASVGGVMPALEAIKRIANAGPLRRFSGVLNGTCNFVLDQLATGATFREAVREAQVAGFAEADPRLDLSGLDAAHKLILLARAAFDAPLPLTSVHCVGIEDIDNDKLQHAREQGLTVRLVAECSLTPHGPIGNVEPQLLPAEHPLAQVKGADNRLIVEPQVGPATVISGRGAGRWPTAEAVMSDLLEIRRENQLIAENKGREECVA